MRSDERPLVAGVGIHPFGRFDKSLFDLGCEAAEAALADAGVAYTEVDLTVASSVYSGMAKGQRLAAHLGAIGNTIVSVESACASSAAALMVASQAIQSGSVRVALCVGFEKAPRGFIPGAGFEDWQTVSGVGVTPIYFALAAAELLHQTDAEVSDLAAVSVKNHHNGALNPFAMYQTPVTVEDVLSSKTVCDPLTLLMLCSPNEGGAAVVLMSADEASRRGVADRAVCLAGLRVVSRSSSDWFVPAPSRRTGRRTSLTARAALGALADAKLSIDQIDVIECQDTDAASELIAYCDLGLCGPGEEAALLRSGDTALTGRVPVNPSGGLLSKGEPLGASGLGQVFEIVTQLRGEAGRRQVSRPLRGLCHVMGAGHVSAVSILVA